MIKDLNRDFIKCQYVSAHIAERMVTHTCGKVAWRDSSPERSKAQGKAQRRSGKRLSRTERRPAGVPASPRSLKGGGERSSVE